MDHLLVWEKMLRKAVSLWEFVELVIVVSKGQKKGSRNLFQGNMPEAGATAPSRTHRIRMHLKSHNDFWNGEEILSLRISIWNDKTTLLESYPKSFELLKIWFVPESSPIAISEYCSDTWKEFAVRMTFFIYIRQVSAKQAKQGSQVSH